MTDSDIQKFLTACAIWNGADPQDPDFDIEIDSPVSAGDVVKTHGPVSEYTRENADKNGLHVRPDFQIAKGMRRGDLFVMDFGGYRLVATTAEGVVK